MNSAVSGSSLMTDIVNASWYVVFERNDRVDLRSSCDRDSEREGQEGLSRESGYVDRRWGLGLGTF